MVGWSQGYCPETQEKLWQSSSGYFGEQGAAYRNWWGDVAEVPTEGWGAIGGVLNILDPQLKPTDVRARIGNVIVRDRLSVSYPDRNFKEKTKMDSHQWMEWIRLRSQVATIPASSLKAFGVNARSDERVNFEEALLIAINSNTYKANTPGPDQNRSVLLNKVIRDFNKAVDGAIEGGPDQPGMKGQSDEFKKAIREFPGREDLVARFMEKKLRTIPVSVEEEQEDLESKLTIQ